ncbi:hypothetical protein ONS95_009561 [Cadophora gregata]|uniref:uncharacterized protein n=1 Tax=Cadophora gregata TaxID=51156 RepID=UPI0026DAE912|nr:uncharacterized protein ONS95_009561 [Cadophora gregata]KAK0124612.1 hypothetical protein ONS95_009561 [Cadophora gregata]
MTYAMFVVMGGIVVDIEHLHNRLKRATLTTNGLLLLGQHGHFFYVEPDAIADKSKANLLAKGLVCVQVLWVARQTIERKVAGLPISLLEYHTLVHVVCALVMYVLWFQKPYDIQYPTMVATDNFPEALAFIVASSKWKGYSGFRFTSHGLDRRNLSIHLEEDPEFTWFGTPTSSASISTSQASGTSPLLAPQDQTSEDHWYQALQDDERLVQDKTNLVIIPAQETSLNFSLSYGQALRSGLGPDRHAFCDKLEISYKDKMRLDLAGNFISTTIDALDKSQPLPSTTFNDPRASRQKRWRKTPLLSTFRPGVIRAFGENLIAYRAENTAGWTDLEQRIGAGAARIVLFMALFLVLSAYAVIHLVAGHTVFPTSIEAILWKNSCYTLLGGIGLAALFYVGDVTGFLDFIINVDFPNWLKRRTPYILFFGLLPVVVLLYTSARMFIVVESFISLRHVPGGCIEHRNRVSRVVYHIFEKLMKERVRTMNIICRQTDLKLLRRGIIETDKF